MLQYLLSLRKGKSLSIKLHCRRMRSKQFRPLLPQLLSHSALKYHRKQSTEASQRTSLLSLPSGVPLPTGTWIRRLLCSLALCSGGNGERKGIPPILAALRMLIWDKCIGYLSSFWLSPSQDQTVCLKVSGRLQRRGEE